MSDNINFHYEKEECHTLRVHISRREDFIWEGADWVHKRKRNESMVVDDVIVFQLKKKKKLLILNAIFHV